MGKPNHNPAAILVCGCRIKQQINKGDRTGGAKWDQNTSVWGLCESRRITTWFELLSTRISSKEDTICYELDQEKVGVVCTSSFVNWRRHYAHNHGKSCGKQKLDLIFFDVNFLQIANDPNLIVPKQCCMCGCHKSHAYESEFHSGIRFNIYFTIQLCRNRDLWLHLKKQKRKKNKNQNIAVLSNSHAMR